MKKLFVLLAAITVSASAVSAQDWGIGLRSGDGLQAVGQKYFSNDNYVEVRFGMNWMHPRIVADFSALYNWHVFDWNWTPGNWFLDFGAGLNVGGRANYVFLGAQGTAKFGYTFENIPLSLSVDYSPSFGPEIGYAKVLGQSFSASSFHEQGLFNGGVSCVYRF
jgi:hypothetical protein